MLLRPNLLSIVKLSRAHADRGSVRCISLKACAGNSAGFRADLLFGPAVLLEQCRYWSTGATFHLLQHNPNDLPCSAGVHPLYLSTQDLSKLLRSGPKARKAAVSQTFSTVGKSLGCNKSSLDVRNTRSRPERPLEPKHSAKLNSAQGLSRTTSPLADV